MAHRIASTTVLVGALMLGGCTDTAQPDAAASPESSSVQSTASSTAAAGHQADPEALLSSAQAALRDAEAVRVSSRGLVARDTDVTTANWHGVWSSNPQTWLADSTIHAAPGIRYTLELRYREGVLEQRTARGTVPSKGAWYPNRAKWIGTTPDGLPNYPVAVVLDATAVDAIALSQGAIIRAEVPNKVADQWFGITGLLDASGLPRVLNGGTTKVAITVDETGFPVKVAYSGDDMELTSDVPDYMLQNMAVSQLTAYYRPTTLPDELLK